MPVTRDPTAVITDPAGGAVPRCCMCSTSGSSTTRNPSTFARIHPGRSTTATLPSSPEPGSPVTSRTGSCTAAASPRSSATTFLASAMLTWGPGRAHLTPVEVATFQSIICEVLTPPPYVGWSPARRPAGSLRVPGPSRRGRSAAPACGQGGGQPGHIPSRRGQARLGQLVSHEGEREQLAVPGVGDAGQRYHRQQVAGLGPHHAERGLPEASEDAAARRQGAGEPGHRQARDDGPELPLIGC